MNNEYKTQTGEYLRVIPAEEIYKRFGKTDLLPIEFEKNMNHELKTNLITTDLYLSYSLAIQYITEWFYRKFPSDFFKHKYVDASHVIDQFNHIPTRELIKNPKPSCHIAVNDDTDYNRENIDLYNLGQTLYTNRARYNDAFFVDREKQLYISLVFMQLKMNYDFNIKLNTKATQDAIFNTCDMAFRAGGSQKHYVDVDMPIPLELIGQLACDLNMCNEDNKFDVTEMLSYFNKHSRLALIYKFNPATQNHEFFLKIPKVLIYIKTSRIQKSQGQIRDMLYTDFTVSFNCEVYFPAIKFFAYYSLRQWENIKSYTKLDTKSFLFGITNLCNIPNIDEHGWTWEARIPYTLESKRELELFNNRKPITVDINDIFKGELREVIEYTKSIALTPETFINTKAFNYLSYIPFTIDWNNMSITFDEPLESLEIYFVIYIDKEYLNNTLTTIKKYKEIRINPTKNIIGDQINLETKRPNL